MLRVSQSPAEFGGHRHCCNRGRVALVCYVSFQDYLTNGSSNFMSGSRSRYVSIVLSLVVIGTMIVET